MIEFSSDGWYGVISDSISFENMSIVAQAVADRLNDGNEGQACVAVGYDTRFLSREYAWQIQRVLTGNGIKVFFHKTPITTSLLAYSTKLYKADLGLMVTGGGRPARYSGLTFRDSKGLPVSEQWLSQLFNYLYRRYPRHGEENRELVDYINILDIAYKYQKVIEGFVDFDVIIKCKPFVVCDSFYGSVGGYFSQLLRQRGIDCIGIRERPNPGFGDSIPQPTDKNLGLLSRLVKDKNACMGLFFNGDGSRLGVVKEGGQPLDFSLFSSMIFNEWLKIKGENEILVTDMTTPARGIALIEYYKLSQKKAIEITEDQDTIENGCVVWKDFSMAFVPLLPDFDAIFQGIILLYGLCRHQMDWESWVREIDTITGVRCMDTKTVGMKKGLWDQKYKEMLGGESPILDQKNLVRIEEERGMKLYFGDGTWMVLDYRPQEEVLNITVDCATLYESQELIRDTVNWIYPD